MRFSVVINTYNRGRSLRETLKALRYQTYPHFEVVVVNGPSTDDTAAVLAEFAGAVRAADCPEVHLSKSRNLGIDAAAGEVVAFIDDDALPEPAWLADLAAAYDSERVGGAGGLVYDHTGFQFQYQYSLCDRLAGTRFDVTPPFDAFNTPGADPFVYLQGTNCSFRRSCLERIGGFDEEIEYYLDEVEVCMRVIDLGYPVRPLGRAIVHHKYLASHMRNHQRLVFDPYATVKNFCYFCLQNGRRTRSTRAVFDAILRYVDDVRAGGETHFVNGRFTARQREFYLHQVDRALGVGTERGLNRTRLYRAIAPARPEQFLPFPTLLPEGRRLTVCLASLAGGEGPGGPIANLAAGLAGMGHEVHRVTRSPDNNRVDFEDGVWVRRLEAAAPEAKRPATDPFEAAAAVYREVCRIHDRGRLDLVAAPAAHGEGLLCLLDDRFPTVLVPPPPTADAKGPTLEKVALARSRHLHPPVERDYCAGSDPLREVVKLYQEITAAGHLTGREGGARPCNPPPHLNRELVEVVREVSGVSPRKARRLAAEILDPPRHPSRRQPLRWLVRCGARLLAYLVKIVNVRQRTFNAAVLRSVRELDEGLDHLRRDAERQDEQLRELEAVLAETRVPANLRKVS